MNIRLNLATRPYIELRPLLARFRIIAVVLAVLAVPLFLLLRAEENKATRAEARVADVSGNIAALRQQETAARERAENGPDAQVLRQAAFLNSLFQRKSFSWTATMSDLEDRLPTGVQVMDIVPIVAPNGHVTIQLRVTGPRERAIDVVRNLEQSRHFLGPRLVGESLSAQTNNGNGQLRPVNEAGAGPANVNFDILAGFRPLPAVTDAPVSAHAAAREARAHEAQLTTPDAAASASTGPTRHRTAAPRHRLPKPSAFLPPQSTGGR